MAAALIAVTTVFIVLASVYLNPDEELLFTMPWAELATVSELMRSIMVFPAPGGETMPCLMR